MALDTADIIIKSGAFCCKLSTIQYRMYVFRGQVKTKSVYVQLFSTEEETGIQVKM